MKNQLEHKVKINDDSEKIKIRKEISHHAKMADIWKNNGEKIKKEMTKIDN